MWLLFSNAGTEEKLGIFLFDLITIKYLQKCAIQCAIYL